MEKKIFNIGNRIVNLYLLHIRGGYLLVDTGYDSNFKGIKKKLKKLQISPKEIKYVFLTHAHDDHAGSLNSVLDITDAKVLLHPKAIAGLKRGQNSFDGGCAGFLAYCFCQILAFFGKGNHYFPKIKKEHLNRLITIGTEEFKKIEREQAFKVIETPGHTNDHISLLKDGILFCGDAAMNGIPSRHRTTIWIENLSDYKKSWEKIIHTNPKMIYPAHGKPFSVLDLNRSISHLSNLRRYPLRKT